MLIMCVYMCVYNMYACVQHVCMCIKAVCEYMFVLHVSAHMQCCVHLDNACTSGSKVVHTKIIILQANILSLNKTALTVFTYYLVATVCMLSCSWLTLDQW